MKGTLESKSSDTVMLKKATPDELPPIELNSASVWFKVMRSLLLDKLPFTFTAISLPMLFNTKPRSAVSPASRMPLPLLSFFTMNEANTSSLSLTSIGNVDDETTVAFS